MAYNWLRITRFSDDTEVAEDVTPLPTLTGEEETYIVGQDDTLLSISFEKYRNHSNWDVIAKVNNIINPFYLPVGTVLIIPNINGIRQ